MLTRAEVGLSLARSSRSKWDFVLDTLHSEFIHFVINYVRLYMKKERYIGT